MTQKWAPTHLGKLALPRANLGRKSHFRPPNRPHTLPNPLLSGSASLTRFWPKGPFALFPHKAYGRQASPPPAKRSGWDTQNVGKIRPPPIDPKPALGQSGAKTNVLEAAEGPSACGLWRTRTCRRSGPPKTPRNKGKARFGGPISSICAL